MRKLNAFESSLIMVKNGMNCVRCSQSVILHILNVLASLNLINHVVNQML